VTKTLARCLEESGIGLDRLIAVSGLDARVVKAIAAGQFTPSPEQRRRLAAALGIGPEEISWGHEVPTQHLRGNGPQCGRST
jgi:hypothetical protein